MDIKNILHNKTLINGGIFTVFSFANQGVSFILLLILAKYIEPGEYGTLNLFNTFVQLFSVIICLGSTGYIGVSFFKKERNDFCNVLNTYLLVATAMLFLFVIIALSLSSVSESVLGIGLKYQLLALFVCYTNVYNTINLDIWRLEEKPVSYGLYSLSSVILNFIITIYLVVSIGQGWLGRLHAQVSVAFVYFVVSIIFLLKRNYLVFKYPSKQITREVLAFSVPMIPHRASGWLKQGADRYIINAFLSVSTVGLYSFAMNFANIIAIIGSSFNSTNSVFIFKKLKDGYISNKSSLIMHEKVMMLAYAIITIFIIIGCYCFIPLAVPNYISSRTFLIPLCLSAMFGCYYTLFVNYLYYYIKTKQLMVITFSVSLIQVLLSLALTRFGALYTAYISAFAQLLTFLCVFMYSRKVLREIEIKENNE